jgi:thiol-disulfide isomerase/thioredoxin
MAVERIRSMVAALLLALTVTTVYAAQRPPLAGEPMPPVEVRIPDDPALQRYLGVSGSGLFSLNRIDADVVIVQILSMYCPHCQREAPVVNRVYEIVEKDPRLKGRIKVVGIGAGNSDFELGIFQKKYDIPFPLFEDQDFTIHEQLGEVRTPYFFVVKAGAGDRREVVYSRLGGLGDPQKFVDRVAALGGLR